MLRLTSPGAGCFLAGPQRASERIVRDCALRGIVFQSNINNREAHRTSMLLAFAFSSAFLISYIVNHALHGDTIFPGHGPGAHAVPFDLASHITPSVVALTDGAHDVLFFADGPVRDAPPNRALSRSPFGSTFRSLASCFRVPQGVCVLDSVLIRLDLREQGQEAPLRAPGLRALGT